MAGALADADAAPWLPAWAPVAPVAIGGVGVAGLALVVSGGVTFIGVPAGAAVGSVAPVVDELLLPMLSLLIWAALFSMSCRVAGSVLTAVRFDPGAVVPGGLCAVGSSVGVGNVPAAVAELGIGPAAFDVCAP